MRGSLLPFESLERQPALAKRWHAELVPKWCQRTTLVELACSFICCIIAQFLLHFTQGSKRLRSTGQPQSQKSSLRFGHLRCLPHFSQQEMQ